MQTLAGRHTNKHDGLILAMVPPSFFFFLNIYQRPAKWENHGQSRSKMEPMAGGSSRPPAQFCCLASVLGGPRPRRKDESAVKPKPQLANLSQQSQVNHSPDGVESFLCSTEWGGIKRNSLNLPNRFWDLKRAQLLYIIYNPGCQSQSNPLFVCSNTQIPRHAPSPS